MRIIGLLSRPTNGGGRREADSGEGETAVPANPSRVQLLQKHPGGLRLTQVVELDSGRRELLDQPELINMEKLASCHPHVTITGSL